LKKVDELDDKKAEEIMEILKNQFEEE